jgi:hypothetical protein
MSVAFLPLVKLKNLTIHKSFAGGGDVWELVWRVKCGK